METGVPPLPLIGIIELQAKTLKILEFKGPVAKIFRNKDLSCQRAMKMVLGQFRGAVLVDRRASKLPQSESLSLSLRTTVLKSMDFDHGWF